MVARHECFVYIQLPGTLQTVVCGKFQRETTRDGGAVGRFVYGRSYRVRSDAVPLDPIHLLICNVDDHPRNHAVVAPGREWRLAPAYDLTPNSRQGQDGRRLAMDCGLLGRVATRENVVSQSVRFGLRPDEANAIVNEVAEVVTRCWRADVLRCGGSERDCEVIEPAFTYPGFEYRA